MDSADCLEVGCPVGLELAATVGLLVTEGKAQAAGCRDDRWGGGQGQGNDGGETHCQLKMNVGSVGEQVSKCKRKGSSRCVMSDSDEDESDCVDSREMQGRRLFRV